MAHTRAKSLSVLALLLVVPVQSGCESTGSSTGQSTIMHQWGDRIGQLGYVVITPPQEDIRVGDIYALGISPDQVKVASASSRREAMKRISAASRWSMLPVLTDLEQEYGQRRAWPRTPDSFMNPGPDSSWQEPISEDHASIFAPGAVPTRLRNVALEQFASVSFSGADLETIIPSEAATLVIGRANANDLAVTMRAGSAEAYSLSLDRVLALLVQDVTSDGRTRYFLNQPYRSNLDLVADAATNHVWLQVVSEVLYIRSADLTIRTIKATPTDDEVTAAELAQVAQQKQESQQPAQPEQSAQQPATTPTPAEPAAQPVPTAQIALETHAVQKLDPIYGAYVRARAINDVLAKGSGDNSPAGVVHFISVTDESSSIRRLWPRGLAVGVRGLSLLVDASTGEILSCGPMGQRLPAARVQPTPATPAPDPAS